MADAKLTALTAASALAGADLFYISQGGVSKKATHTQLLALVGTTYVPLAGGTMTGALTIASGTLTASAPALSITQTWNNAAVGFKALLVNITDAATSAYATASLLELQTGGVSRFRVDRDGYFQATGFTSSTTSSVNYYGTGLRQGSTSEIAWTSGGISATADLFLYRDAAATLAQRNGTTQQIFRLYNTYTDSSNYERLTLTGVAGTSVNITAETMGTGGDNLDIVLSPAGAGSVYFPGGTYVSSTGYFITSGLTAGWNSSVNYHAVGFRTRASGEVAWTSGYLADAVDTALFRDSAGVAKVTDGGSNYRDLKLRNLLQTEYSQLTEMTAPAAPAANSVRIYAEDNGSGKTRLMALFATGSAVQLGIEP